MSSGVMPLGKVVYVCDDVSQDAVTANLNVTGVFSAVSPPDGASYPFHLSQMCVFAQFAGGIGRVAVEAKVVDAVTGNEVFGSPVYFINFPGGQVTVSVVIRMLDCPFPQPGTFLVQLFCLGTFVDDRRVLAL